MTFGEKFIQDNVIIENDRKGTPRRAYLLCRDADKIDLNDPTKLLNPGIRRHTKCDTENRIISFETHIRFKNAIKSAEDNIPRIFIFLNQMMTEAAIRRYFKEVWLEHNNLKARKRNTHDFQMMARALKQGRIRIDPIHRECFLVTRNRSVRKAACESRVFT